MLSDALFRSSCGACVWPQWRGPGTVRIDISWCHGFEPLQKNSFTRGITKLQVKNITILILYAHHWHDWELRFWIWIFKTKDFLECKFLQPMSLSLSCLHSFPSRYAKKHSNTFRQCGSQSLAKELTNWNKLASKPGNCHSISPQSRAITANGQSHHLSTMLPSQAKQKVSMTNFEAKTEMTN